VATRKKTKGNHRQPSAFWGLLPRREYSAYKNQFGRIGVVAGSKGFVGAALMTSQGALRAGAGLVEVFVPEEIYEIVASAAPMEAMVKPVRSYHDLLKQKPDVWAVGPGLGKSLAAEVLKLIENAKQPMVIDATGSTYSQRKPQCSGVAKANGCSRASGRDETPFPRPQKNARRNCDEILQSFCSDTFCSKAVAPSWLSGIVH